MRGVEFRLATVDDAKGILEVYAPYVLNTAITFEYDVPTADNFRARIESTMQSYPYLVVLSRGKIVGYAYAGRFHERAAFGHSAELSVYVSSEMKGQGIGKKLYLMLENELKKQGIINLYACIAYCETEDCYLTHDSVRFHEKMGYKLVGRLNKCGYKFGRWYDVVYMEKFIGSHN